MISNRNEILEVKQSQQQELARNNAIYGTICIAWFQIEF